MTTCEFWQRAFDPGADPADPELAAHLEGCGRCREALAKWRAIGPGIGSAAVPDIPVRDRLVLERVRARLVRPARPAALRPAWIGAAIASAAAIALVAVYARPPAGGAPAPRAVGAPAAVASVLPPGGGTPRELPIEPGRPITAPPGGRASARIGAHRIEIESDSSVSFSSVSPVRVALEISRGAASFAVDFGGAPGEFTVAAGDVVVAVRGTQFRVSRDESRVAVGVVEGRVAVSRAGGEIAVLSPGEKIEIDAWASESAASAASAAAAPAREPDGFSGVAAAGRGAKTPASGTAGAASGFSPQAPGAGSPDLATLREWIVAGRLVEAEAGLIGLVARDPADADAWWTLGDCRRRARDFDGAVEAYSKVIEVGAPEQADLARLRAGAILQERLGRHDDAVALLLELLRAGDPASPLRAEVLVRCGRSLAALGRGAEAEPLLREVVERHAANPVAAEARALLEKMR